MARVPAIGAVNDTPTRVALLDLAKRVRAIQESTDVTFLAAIRAALDPRYVAVPLTWTAVTFTGAWVNFGGTFNTAQYRKEGDVVRLRGAIKTGTLTTSAFTLPVGFRPPAALGLVAMMAATPTFGVIYVNADGTVTPYTGANTEVHLDNISFSTVA